MSWQIDLYTNYDWTDDSYDTHYDLMDYSGDNISQVSGFSKTETLHKDGKPVLNKATFNVTLKTSMANDLLTLDYDDYVYCTITKDAAAWFTGFARPVTSWEVDSTGGVIQFEVVDTTYMLKRRPADGSALSKTSTDNMDVCNTGTTAQSMVHYILGDADWDFGTSLFNVTDSIDYYLEKDDTYYDLLAELLFSYHCTFYADASGQFCLYDWAPASIAIDRTYNDANIMEGFSVDRDDSDNDGVEVTWYKTETEEDATIFFWDDITSEIDDTETWPEDDGDAETDETLFQWDVSRDGGEVIGADSVVAEVFLYLWNGLEFSPVWYATGWVGEDGEGSIGPRDGVSVCTVSTATHNASSLNTNYQITSTRDRTKIKSFRIRGDIAWKIEQPVAGSPTTYRNPLKIDGKYLYTSTSAEELAQGYYYLSKYGSYKYKLRSETASAVGDYITIAETTLNISTTARVTQVKTTQINGTQLYDIEAEGAAEIGSIYAQVSGGKVVIFPATGEILNATQAVANGMLPTGEIIKGIDGSFLESYTPDEDGIYIVNNTIGFYDATEEAWLIKIENDGGTGKIYAGDGGTTAGTDKFLQWDGTDLTISGDMYLSGDSEIKGSVAVGETLAVAGSITIGDHMTIDGAEVGVEITDGSDDMKIILGYMGNAPIGWLNAAGEQLDGDDYGLYVAGGNMVVADGARFEDGDYFIQHDAAYIIKDSGGTERGRFGSLGVGEPVGLKIGSIDYDAGTGTGIYADEDGNAMYSGILTVGSLPYLSDEGLEAYWSFDDGLSGSADGATLTDNSGNGNNATADGCTWVTGKSGKALDFDGTDDYVDTTYSNPASYPFTASVWFKHDDYSDNSVYRYLLDNSPGAAGFTIRKATTLDGKLNIFSYGSAGVHDMLSGVIEDNNWHLVQAVFEATKTTVYIDGVENNSITYTSDTFVPGANTLTIGASVGGGGNYFDGSIDEVRIYSRALSANEVKYLYLNPGGASGRTVISGDSITTGTISAVNINLNDVFVVSGTTGIITYAADEVELGSGADASGTHSVSIGINSGGTGNNGVSIGDDANFGSNYSTVVVGYQADVGGNYGTAIGYQASANYVSTVAIGPDSVADANAQFDLNTNALNLTAFYFGSGEYEDDIHAAIYGKTGAGDFGCIGFYGTERLEWIDVTSTVVNLYRAEDNQRAINYDDDSTTLGTTLKILVIY